MVKKKREPFPVVSTSSLIGYLLTIVAWEAEAVVLLNHLIANKKLDPLRHAVLIMVWGSLTLFTCFKGKEDFKRLRHTGGRITLTLFQGVLVALFMILFGCVLAWID